ncbi:hypothetical protein CC1G_14305 [Coprinopsis cinerea okayama7|uniref:Uncharacterized protein n=1 Tax=Coprinopsis cinerea (strain Okayama-7 / 130 / ATCC MYA-4618 / FGSC 9003) TaxID=240176 RepID=D6RLT1_COPC7|nr:hypothetical protein CC1G_14305 [Coprinopsis cinerea okayama7\|eukprot:XP_002911774.1 hypothetical protein CC1G_14305 [Coprinopsis cinerea okayama7\
MRNTVNWESGDCSSQASVSTTEVCASDPTKVLVLVGRNDLIEREDEDLNWDLDYHWDDDGLEDFGDHNDGDDDSPDEECKTQDEDDHGVADDYQADSAYARLQEWYAHRARLIQDSLHRRPVTPTSNSDSDPGSPGSCSDSSSAASDETIRAGNVSSRCTTEHLISHEDFVEGFLES